MQFFFFRNCTHILTRTQGKKFEDKFLVKIVSKGTSLNFILIWPTASKVTGGGRGAGRPTPQSLILQKCVYFDSEF